MHFRTAIAIVAFVGLPLRAPGQSQQSKSLQESPSYVKQTFNKSGAARTVAGAGFEQATGAPHEWGGGMQGFGKRLASGFGSHIVKHTIQYPIAKFRHEHVGYIRSDEKGVGPRMKHALLATVITPRTDREGNTIATGHIAGALGAGFISRLWQPERLHTVASGFSTAGLIFVADAGGNVLREFWPEIRHPRSHGAKPNLFRTNPGCPSKSRPKSLRSQLASLLKFSRLNGAELQLV
jgi:hypothetical protein